MKLYALAIALLTACAATPKPPEAQAPSGPPPAEFLAGAVKAPKAFCGKFPAVDMLLPKMGNNCARINCPAKSLTFQWDCNEGK